MHEESACKTSEKGGSSHIHVVQGNVMFKERQK